jgi:arsenite methyltransferase
MNEIKSCCDTEEENSVSRDDVKSFYSNAALSTQESLCCPAEYNPDDLSHIPSEVRDISYGCGSPVNRAGIRKGETFVDLGSGGGIDCFIAAKYVGESGKVFGIDMTDEMLAVARKNTVPVAENLGYNNIEFKQGFLESIPMEDESVNIVTSNCVINLSVNKDAVFKEIHRILKPGGRFVIADIISEGDVPEEMRSNRELWGECISGALTLDEFIASAKASGFHGIKVKKDYLWKVVEGIHFASYILEGYKLPNVENASCCKSLIAIYSGPFESTTWNGLNFKAGEAVEIDEETAMILRIAPFAEHFSITDPELEGPSDDDSCCG